MNNPTRRQIIAASAAAAVSPSLLFARKKEPPQPEETKLDIEFKPIQLTPDEQIARAREQLEELSKPIRKPIDPYWYSSRIDYLMDSGKFSAGHMVERTWDFLMSPYDGDWLPRPGEKYYFFGEVFAPGDRLVHAHSQYGIFDRDSVNGPRIVESPGYFPMFEFRLIASSALCFMLTSKRLNFTTYRYSAFLAFGNRHDHGWPVAMLRAPTYIDDVEHFDHLNVPPRTNTHFAETDHETDQWICERCGENNDIPGECITQTRPKFNVHRPIELGGNPRSWNELHQCFNCRNLVWLEQEAE